MNKITEYIERAPFTFVYIESMLRKKNFGILSTVTTDGKPHSVGVVYAVSPPTQPFSIYLLSRTVLKKVKNILNNPRIAFVVPFPHYFIRMIPYSCIQFQGKAEIISFDDPIAIKLYQNSIVLKRSLKYNLSLSGENTFIKIVPDNKIFSFGIGSSIWDILFRSKSRNLKSYYVIIPEGRRINDKQ